MIDLLKYIDLLIYVPYFLLLMHFYRKNLKTGPAALYSTCLIVFLFRYWEIPGLIGGLFVVNLPVLTKVNYTIIESLTFYPLILYISLAKVKLNLNKKKWCSLLIPMVAGSLAVMLIPNYYGIINDSWMVWVWTTLRTISFVVLGRFFYPESQKVGLIKRLSKLNLLNKVV